MGIPSWIEKAEIEIKREKLTNLHKDISEYISDKNSDSDVPNFDDMILFFGFVFQYNENADVVGIREDCEKTYYEEDFMDLLSPYIESGSYIQLGVSGEAGDSGDILIKWSFVNGKVIAENNLTTVEIQNTEDRNKNKKIYPNNIKISDWTAIYQKKYFKINAELFIKEMNDRGWSILLQNKGFKPFKRDSLEYVYIYNTPQKLDSCLRCKMSVL